jgi:hypothetical protein
MTVHAMTIDAEDWFQVGAYEGGVHRSEWARYPSRIEANVETILALLAGAFLVGLQNVTHLWFGKWLGKDMK